ncbi:MAG: 5-deoxy-glucuronate isomerase, partial [Verrucomicrobia bacterium]|nr:5-deoxy-glucuronate isomerase [Verrucomicrobiota bacterium]
MNRVPDRPPTSPLLVRPSADTGEYTRVTLQRAGWEHLNFAARRMARGEHWESTTGDLEFGCVLLGGTCSVNSRHGHWFAFGRRGNVFA